MTFVCTDVYTHKQTNKQTKTMTTLRSIPQLDAVRPRPRAKHWQIAPDGPNLAEPVGGAELEVLARLFTAHPLLPEAARHSDDSNTQTSLYVCTRWRRTRMISLGCLSCGSATCILRG